MVLLEEELLELMLAVGEEAEEFMMWVIDRKGTSNWEIDKGNKIKKDST